MDLDTAGGERLARHGGELADAAGSIGGAWSAEGVLDSGAELTTWRARAAALVGFATLGRLVLLATTGLSDTEAYYAVWSRFPSWSYYDHPPLVAWLIGLTSWGSTSPFAIRLGAVLCSAALGLSVYRFSEKLFSARAGFFALAIVTALPAFTFTSFIINPEGPLAPLWVIYLSLLFEMGRGKESGGEEIWRPLGLGAVMGVAFLAKYTAILLLPITLAFLALTPRARHWFRRPTFYAGGLLALAIVAPVIWWNHVHHWPSIQLHLVERVETATLATFLERLKHLAIGQILFFHPVFFPALIAMIGWTAARARRDERFRLLAIAGAPVLLFFFVMMLRVKDAESHWPMVGYIALSIAAGAWLDRNLHRANRWIRYGWRGGLAMSVALSAIYFLHTQTPSLMKRLPEGAYDAKVDALNETFGWDELRSAIATHRERLGDRAVVASSHNVLCGHLLIALDDRPPVYCASPQRTEFDFLARRDPPSGVPVIYVDTDRYPQDPEPLLSRACQARENVEVFRGGRVVNRFRISVCPPRDAVASARP